MLQYFLRIAEFACLPRSELTALAATAHVIFMPAGRQLLKSGRSTGVPPDYLYLLRGSVELMPGRRPLKARRLGPLCCFFPGCDAARTLSGCQILRVDGRRREFALQRCGAVGLPQPAGSEQWLQRFLSSHMMRRLSPRQWQHLLSSFSTREFDAGEQILVQHCRGDECYVLAAGHALVHAGARTLKHLNPGDFFGEDALLLDGRRTADVSALSAVRVQSISREVFLQVLASALIEAVPETGAGDEFLLAGGPGDEGVPLPQVRDRARRLDPRRVVYVRGGNRRQRALAAFLLIQQGVQAYPVETAAAVRQERSDRGPTAAGHGYARRAAPKSDRSDSVQH